MSKDILIDGVNARIDKAFLMGQKHAMDLACLFLQHTEIEVNRMLGKTSVKLPEEYIDKFRLYMMKHIYEPQKN